MNARHTFDDVETALRTAGMSFPEVTEDFPWGHRALKVRGKAFVFIARELGGLSLSVKLPESNAIALSMPFVAPTGYGLGRSGWVTATLPAAAHVPLAVLLSWLEESYRAIASQIRFFETSRLLTEAAAQQIERICRRYADGQISLDLFLSELGNTAHLIHAEAQ